MSVIEIPTPTEAAAYAERLHAVVENFNQLGHGARLQAALSLGVSSSVVSGILNMRGVDLDLLDKLGAWARDERTRRGI